MSGDVAAEIAAVLAEHEFDLSGLRRDPDAKAGYWIACRCGFEWTPVEPCDQHRAHVAEALAPLIAERVRAAQAEELREAADDGQDFLGDETDSFMAWEYLRNRADRIGGDPR